MSPDEILSAYEEHLITAHEAMEQAGVDSIGDLYDAASGPAEGGPSRSPQLHAPMAAQVSQG